MAKRSYHQIREFFKTLSLLANRDGRQAFVTSAGLDDRLAQQIQYDLPPATFVPHLVELAVRYSNTFDRNHSLIKLLEAAKSHVGQEKGEQCGRFIRQLLTDTYTDEPDEHLTRPWNVPYPRNPYFTGRGEVLQNLYATLHTEHRAALSQVQAISGLGGIGKTQTAVEYAYRHCEEYAAVLWVLADSAETLFSGMAALARALGLREQHAREQEQAVNAVRRWFSANTNWLLIFDNADDPALLKPYLLPNPQGYPQGGHIIITSRARVLDAAGVAQPFSLDILSTDEAERFLLERTRPGDQSPGLEIKDAKAPCSSDSGLEPASLLRPGIDARETQEHAALTELVQELGGLPLALEQAGAYIREVQCTFGNHLTAYRKRKLALLERHAPGVGTHPQSVAATWTLNFEQVQQESEAAADILRLSAFLHPEDIPEELLIDGAANILESFDLPDDDPLALDEALMPLTRFYLITRNAVAHTYNIHRMVQAALQAALPDDEQRHWAEQTVNVVNTMFPSVEFETWPLCERLLDQALKCSELIDHQRIASAIAGRLLNQTASYLHDRARYAEAEPLYQRSLGIREQGLGPDHPDVATSLNNLAELYRVQGRYTDAEPLYQRSLRIVEQALGPEHPQVATCLNNLALLYEAQGRYAEAEPLYQRSLRIVEQVLGPDHPHVAISLNNLAGLYWAQGRYAEAEPLVQRSLRILEQAFDGLHPNLATGLKNYADLLRTLGRDDEADTLEARAAAIRERLEKNDTDST